jgi:hypothetical protein
VPVDFDEVNQALQYFLRSHRWIYDETRKCPRNMQNPGNYDQQQDNHLQISAKWELKNGPPKLRGCQPFRNVRVKEYAMLGDVKGFTLVQHHKDTEDNSHQSLGQDIVSKSNQDNVSKNDQYTPTPGIF